MIVILTQQEVDKLKQMKARGKSDQKIILALMTNAKFDIRVAPDDIDESRYKKVNFGRELPKVDTD
ncbi:MAG: hypothetical protein WC346_03990 [Methanogenium sp.]|jgi:hypothetical protein